MEWVAEVLTSEFFWGIVFGLILSVFGTFVSAWLNNFQRRKTVAVFCQDLIGSISDLIQKLEENRERNQLIDHEFLNTIDLEIQVYSRNREHLVVLDNTQLQRDVWNYFTRVSVLLAQIQWHLAQSFEFRSQSQLLGDDAEVRSNQHLNEAHNRCDRLREMKDQRIELDSRLESYSRRLFRSKGAQKGNN